MVQRVDFRSGREVLSGRTCAMCGRECEGEMTIEYGKMFEGEYRFIAMFCGWECEGKWMRRRDDGI